MLSESREKSGYSVQATPIFFLTLRNVRYCYLSLSKQGRSFLRKCVAALPGRFDWPCPYGLTQCSPTHMAHGLSQVRCWGGNWFYEG